MTRHSGIWLMVCALIFIALVGPGHAADATIRANAAIQGEGRFYQATENLILFSGFFQGAINVSDHKGDLTINAASLTCPGMLEIDTTTRTQKGEGRCLFLTQDGTHIYARWTCTGTPGQGCGGTFSVLGGTGRLANTSGQGDFMLASTVMEVVLTLPKGGVTGNFTGRVEWPELKLTSK